jgi:hypothetical protein
MLGTQDALLRRQFQEDKSGSGGKPSLTSSSVVSTGRYFACVFLFPL